MTTTKAVTASPPDTYEAGPSGKYHDRKIADQPAARTGKDDRHSHDAGGEANQEFSFASKAGAQKHCDCNAGEHVHERGEVMLVDERSEGNRPRNERKCFRH